MNDLIPLYYRAHRARRQADRIGPVWDVKDCLKIARIFGAGI